ncbi:MAG: hypothetical protein HYX57_13010 [Chloroflexi bacterium]|nr:hypothetical protein [Chloroflexota bacterium]
MTKRRLVVDGPVGATRQRGQEWRHRLEELLRGSSSGDLVEVDLTALEAMSVSFADELIGRFLADRLTGDFQDRAVVIIGGSEDVRETLEAVLERRDAGALYRDGAGKVEALAGPSWFRETVELANDLREFSANDLAVRLNKSPQAVNNRLKQLAASGAVLRERGIPQGGGKEFTYRAATAILGG